jgi:hypothetical protein
MGTIKCINFGTPTTVDELNDALNEGYKFQFTAGVVMWLHKPDEPSDAEQAYHSWMAQRPGATASPAEFHYWVEDGKHLAKKYGQQAEPVANLNEWLGSIREIP